jgi:hypothetical protein
MVTKKETSNTIKRNKSNLAMLEKRNTLNSFFKRLIILVMLFHRVLGFPRSFFSNRQSIRTRTISSTSICRLNRFLFDTCEISNSGDLDEVPTIIIPKDDYRTVHAAKTLGLKNGDTIRAGVVSCKEHNGLKTDEATVEWIPEGKVKKAEVLKNGNPPGSLSVQLNKLTLQEAPSEMIHVSLILALPRP